MIVVFPTRVDPVTTTLKVLYVSLEVQSAAVCALQTLSNACAVPDFDLDVARPSLLRDRDHGPSLAIRIILESGIVSSTNIEGNWLRNN